MANVTRKFLVHRPINLINYLHDSTFIKYVLKKDIIRDSEWNDFVYHLKRGYWGWQIKRGYNTWKFFGSQYMLKISPWIADCRHNLAENLYLNKRGQHSLGFVKLIYLSLEPVAELKIVKNHRYQFWSVITLKNQNVLSKDGSNEFEWSREVTAQEAKRLLRFRVKGSKIVEKFRFAFPYSFDENIFWEIDVYLDKNYPLFIASIELPSERYDLTLDKWVGSEITKNDKYNERYLTINPFGKWGKWRSRWDSLSIYGERKIDLKALARS